MGMEINTNGHNTPQNANCATTVRLLNTDAALSGKGMIAGTINRNAYNATMPHCSLRNSGAWSRRKSAIREVALPSTAAMVKPSLFSPASRRNQDALRDGAGAGAGTRAGLSPTQRSSAQTTTQ
ncbi:hypothetical protein D3C87_1634600 [compost metagenome]